MTETLASDAPPNGDAGVGDDGDAPPQAAARMAAAMGRRIRMRPHDTALSAAIG